ncbi:hypothetical protein HN51_052096 [Arachis hypogaea]
MVGVYEEFILRRCSFAPPSSSALILDAAFLHLDAHLQRRIPLFPSSSSSLPSPISACTLLLLRRSPTPAQLSHTALLPLCSSVTSRYSPCAALSCRLPLPCRFSVGLPSSSTPLPRTGNTHQIFGCG